MAYTAKRHNVMYAITKDKTKKIKNLKIKISDNKNG